MVIQMRKILEELYFGNIDPNEIRGIYFEWVMWTFTESEKMTELFGGKKLFLELVNTHELTPRVAPVFIYILN